MEQRTALSYTSHYPALDALVPALRDLYLFELAQERIAASPFDEKTDKQYAPKGYTHTSRTGQRRVFPK